MHVLVRHRPAVVAAAVVAVLSASTALPAAVATESAPVRQAVVIDAPSIGEVQALTASAAEAIEAREAVGRAQAVQQAANVEAKREAITVAREAQRVAREADLAALEAERRATKRAEAARAAAAERAARSRARAVADPRSVAAQMAASRYGWGDDQFGCLDSLWVRESNWRHTATNPASGAYGIPQSLPAAKMASHGSDWQTNPITQISWGLEYIRQVYGTPCGAWGHSEAVGWY